MKRKIITCCAILACLLIGCSKSTVSKEYGVDYNLSEDCFIRFYLDPSDCRKVNAIYIVANKDNRQSGFDGDFPSDIKEDIPISYAYTDDQEVIYFRFYNKDFDYTKAAPLFEYAGLDKFTNRPNLKDIVKNEEFAYKNIIQKGTLTTNISFSGDGEDVDINKALS